jgi:hypothetical protein
MVWPNVSQGAIELHTSLDTFIQNAGPTDALITNEIGVVKADQVSTIPTQNLNLGNVLTFNRHNSQFDIYHLADLIKTFQ